jgi:hypothetical protein
VCCFDRAQVKRGKHDAFVNSHADDVDVLTLATSVDPGSSRLHQTPRIIWASSPKAACSLPVHTQSVVRVHKVGLGGIPVYTQLYNVVLSIIADFPNLKCWYSWIRLYTSQVAQNRTDASSLAWRLSLANV